MKPEDITRCVDAEWRRSVTRGHMSRAEHAELRDERIARASQLKRQIDANGLENTPTSVVTELERILCEVHVLDHEVALKARDMDGREFAIHRGMSGSGSGITRDTVTLRADQSFADWTRVRGLGPKQPSRDQQLSLGKWLKGVVTGDWAGSQLEMQASLQEGTIGGGGALVPSPLSAMLIDVARSKARVIQAGAQTVPMFSSTLAIARLASDPAAAWKTESAAVAAPTDPTFERVTLTARTLVGFLKLSRELFEDAANLDTVLRDAFGKALALQLDRAALYGSGIAPEPKGIKNTSGITTKNLGTNGAAPTSYDFLVDQAQALWEANFDGPTAFIMAPRTRGELGRLKDTIGQPVEPPAEIADVPRYDTTQVPVNLTQGSANTASDLFGGVWNQLLIGLRHGITVELLGERFSADTFEFGLLAHLRADIALAHPAAFVVTSGVL